MENAALRVLVERPARKQLRAHYAKVTVDRIIENARARYHELEPTVPRTEGFTVRVLLRCAAYLIALHDVPLAQGETEDTASALLSRVTWAASRRWSRLPWFLAGLVSRNDRRRLKWATRFVRCFPGREPGFDWEDMPEEVDAVAFECRQCPVASYFEDQGFPELCVSTFCELSTRLARQWGATLERNGCIAGGAEACDFRWRKPGEGDEVQTPVSSRTEEAS